MLTAHDLCACDKCREAVRDQELDDEARWCWHRAASLVDELTGEDCSRLDLINVAVGMIACVLGGMPSARRELVMPKITRDLEVMCTVAAQQERHGKNSIVVGYLS